MYPPQPQPQSHQPKAGSIIAACGGVLGVIAFFFLPLVNILFISMTAQQVASLGASMSSYQSPSVQPTPLFGSNTTPSTASSASSLGYLWLMAVVAVLIIVFAVIPLFQKSAAPQGYPGYPQAPYPQQPHTGYGVPVPPTPYGPAYPTATRGVGSILSSVGVIVLGAIAFLVMVIWYISASQQNTFGISGTSFLGSGFWVYLLSMLAAVVGGIIQLSASRRAA